MLGKFKDTKNQGFPLYTFIYWSISFVITKQQTKMSLKKEFEILVKEANQKIILQNKKREAEEAKLLKELHIRQKQLIQILRKGESQGGFGLQE